MKNAAVALLCLSAAALSRLPAFGRSVLDWDESLYFLIAEQWRAGHLPYTTIWDNKPVGIYAIFALFQAMFGDRVAAMRIATIAFAGLGAFGVFRIAWLMTRRGACGAVAAAAFIVGSLSNDGLAANTELFMAAFTTLAVLTAVTPMAGWRQALLAGVCMGCAFMTKYVAIFEDPAILLLILLQHRKGAAPLLALGTVAGAALQVAAVAALYWHAGALPLWWNDAIASNFRRVGAAVSPGALRYITQLEIRRWGPLYLVAFAVVAAALRRPSALLAPAGRTHLFLVLWLLGGGLGVAAAKSFYDHYFLQLLPALCVALGWAAQFIPRRWPRPAKFALLLLVLAAPAAAAVRATAAECAGGNTPAVVARGLAAPLAANPSDGIYVFDDQPIIYALAHRPPPTRYVLPSVLTTVFLARVAGIDPVAEVRRILATRPAFIICRSPRPAALPAGANPAVYAAVDAALAAHYSLWRRAGGTAVYRLVASKRS